MHRRSPIHLRRAKPKLRLSLLLLVASILFTGGCRELAEIEADDSMQRAEQALQHGNWQKADELFHEIILLDPTRPEAWIGRGMTQTQLGDPEYAREHYEEALRLYEEQLEEAPKSKHLLRGQVMLLVLLNRKDEAQTIAAAAAESHPDPAFAEDLIASIESTATRFPEMILPAEKEN